MAEDFDSQVFFDRRGISAAVAASLCGRRSAAVVGVYDGIPATISQLRRHPERLSVLDVRDLRSGRLSRNLQRGAHSLACAGLVGGRNGVAPGTPLLILGAPSEDNLQGEVLRWAAGLSPGHRGDPRLAGQPRRPADVISISLQLFETAPLVNALRDLLAKGRSGKGTVVVLAAGNLAEPRAQTLAKHGLCLTVGATAISETGHEEVAEYSSFGENVDVYAPSGARLGRSSGRFDKVTVAALPFAGKPGYADDELLRFPEGSAPENLRGFYSLDAGTSTSTAMVAGVVALMLRGNPFLSAVEVKEILRATAVRLPDSGKGEILRVDAAAAVAASIRELGRPRASASG